MPRLVTPLASALALGLALAGCMAAGPAAQPAAPPAGAAAVKAGSVRAVGRMAIRERAGYGLKQTASRTILPFARVHLQWIDVYLTNLSAGGEPVWIKSVHPDQFDAPLELVNLKYASQYEITLKAFQAEDADEPSSVVEAQVDGANATIFTTGTNELVDLDANGGILLTLKDRAFAGRAPGAIVVTDGALTSTEEPEGVEGWVEPAPDPGATDPMLP